MPTVWPYVEIEWEDAAFYDGNHSSEKFVETHMPVIRKTIGLLFHEDDYRYFIASTRDNPVDDSKDDCAEINVIPKCMAIKRPLRLRSNRKKR